MGFLPRVTLSPPFFSSFYYFSSFLPTQLDFFHHLSSSYRFNVLLLLPFYISWSEFNLFDTTLPPYLGQPMSIDFDTVPPRAPRAPRRSASVPTSASLLNRIQKPPLAERLSRDDSTIKAPSGPYVHSFFPLFNFCLPCFFLSFRRAFTGGPVRNRPSRGGGGGGGSTNTNTNIARPLKAPKKPKTAAELDQELDEFMGDADVSPGDAASVAGDVDMA